MHRFAFLIHPMDMRDVVRFEPRAAGKRQALVEKILEWTPAHKASHITGIRSVNGETQGWFVAIPFLPHQFLGLPREFVYEKIIRGGRIAEELGAEILGLGGFTSVVGDAGITISRRLNIAVTSGNSYTIATAIEGTLEAARRLEIELPRATAAVIGASGSIGSVCAQMIAREVGKVILVARNAGRLESLAEKIFQATGRQPSYFTDVSVGVKNADIIITATSSTGSIIRPHDLKPGSLICDVALPHDVCREVASLRPDVLVIEGGLVRVPGEVNFDYDFGYPDGISLACMAETIILALEGRIENFSLGRGIRIEQVEEIKKLAEKHGFRLAGFRSFDRWVTPDKIEEVKSLARRQKSAKLPRQASE